jgi:predicted acetyltransferase
VICFEQGHSAETIQQLYPALNLEEVYGAIAYYQANRDEVHQYLERQDELWDQVRQSAAQDPSPVVQRLRALNAVSGSTTP